MRRKLFFPIPLVGILANFIQWYTYSSFNFLGGILIAQFLPNSPAIVKVVAIIYLYLTPIVIRPLGAIIFGNFSDTFGRKITITLTLSLASIATFLMVVTPNFATAGFIAPAFFILFYILLGIVSGVFWILMATFISESVEAKKRNFSGSLNYSGVFSGALFSLVILSIVSLTSPASFLANYGWRLILLSGAVLGLILAILSCFLDETKPFLAAKKKDQKRHAECFLSLKQHKRQMVIAAGLAALEGGILNLFIIPSLKFTSTKLESLSPVSIAFSIMALLLNTLLCPLFGKIADKIGGVKMQMCASFFILIFTIPLAEMLYFGPIWAKALGCLSLSVLSSLYLAPLTNTLTLLFPPHWRVTSLGASYSIAYGIFGGFVFVIFNYLQLDATQVLPRYTVACALITFTCLFFLRKKEKELLSAN